MNWLSRYFKNRNSEVTDETTPVLRGIPAGAFCNAVELPDDAGDAGPDGFIRAVPVGLFPLHHNGAHEVTREHVQQMADNFERSGVELLFDVDHQSIWGSTRAAGWSNAVEAREDGLYVRFPDWTAYGKPYVDSREYRYLSPVYFLNSLGKDGSDRGARIHSIALTNLPYFDEREIDYIGNRSPAQAPEYSHDSPPEEENIMDRKLLINSLGLAETATDEEITAEVERLKANQAPVPGPEKKETPATPATPPAAGDGDGEDDLAAKVNSLEERLRARDEKDARDQAEALVNQAISDRKILPTQKATYVNAALADFAATKAEIDGMTSGTVTPQKLRVNSGSPADGTPKDRFASSVNQSLLEHVNKQQAAR